MCDCIGLWGFVRHMLHKIDNMKLCRAELNIKHLKVGYYHSNHDYLYDYISVKLELKHRKHEMNCTGSFIAYGQLDFDN